MPEQTKQQQPKNDQRLGEALSTIAEVVVGTELDSVKDSVKHLGVDMNKRVDHEIQELRNAVAAQVDELAKKLEDSVKQQKEALDRLDRRVSKIVADSESRVVSVEEGMRKSMRSARKNAERDLADRDAALKKEIDGLAQGMAQIQLGLHEQTETTTRVSALLDNMAHVFGAIPGATPPQANPQAAADTVAGEMPVVDPEDSGADLDGTVDKLFAK